MAAVLSDRGHRSDAAERPGMTACCEERVQGGSALARLPLHMQGRSSRLIGQIAAAS